MRMWLLPLKRFGKSLKILLRLLLKVVDGTAEKAGEAAKDPVGTAVKTALEGPINDFLISL